MLKNLKLGDLFTPLDHEYPNLVWCDSTQQEEQPYYVVTSTPRVVEGQYRCSVRCVLEDGVTDFYSSGGWDPKLIMRWVPDQYRIVLQGDPWDEPVC